MLPRVLIVDDDEPMRLLTRALLGEAFAVEMVASGTEALQLIRASGPYAVVFADHWLPDMTGTDLLVEVERLSSETIRLMLSGDPRPETEADSLNRAHVFEFVRKPCTPAQLRAAVAQAVRHHQQLAVGRP